MADRYKFLGPKDPARETSSAIVVNGREVGIGDVFEADERLLSKLGRFKVEKVSRAKEVSKGTEQVSQEPAATLTSKNKSEGPYPQKGVTDK